MLSTGYMDSGGSTAGWDVPGSSIPKYTSGQDCTLVALLLNCMTDASRVFPPAFNIYSWLEQDDVCLGHRSNKWTLLRIEQCVTPLPSVPERKKMRKRKEKGAG